MINGHDSYDPKKCNYHYIQTELKDATWDQKCDMIAKGFCNTNNHFLNPYRVYYCILNKTNYTNMIFILLSAWIMMFLFLSMNHIRRRYFVKPMLKMREILDLSGPMAEVTLLPLIQGISPLLVRLQGATHNLDFSFNLGGSLGAMFNILAFSVGLCACVLGYSAKVFQGKLIIHIAFMLLAIGLYFMITLTQEAGPIEGGLFLFLYAVYLFIRWMMSGSAKKGKILNQFNFDFDQ